MNPPLLNRLPVPLAVSALTVLGFVSSCLEPGSLSNEDTFRLGSNFPSIALEGGPGCAEACALIASKCATAECHSASDLAADLDLQSPNLVSRLSSASALTLDCFDLPLLVPGSPEQSTIFTKLLDPPACGLKMPLSGSLSKSEIDCIGRWVLAPSCGKDGAAPAADAGRDAMPVMPPPADGSTTMPPPAVTEVIWMEAESAASLIAPMEVGSDPLASGGAYISVATALTNDTPDTTTTGIASSIFDVEQGGTYTVFGRVLATFEDDDSFWVRVDTGAWIQWNHLPKGAWTWDDVHDTDQLDQTVTFSLSPGQHTISVMYREQGAKLDRLVITNDRTFVPMGVGQ
jgi:hypothetical protein